jgi:predicted metalloprotease with PDZ domain
VARWPRTEAGEKAGELLAKLRSDPRRSKALAEQTTASRRAYLTAQARALEGAGRAEEARILWERMARLSAGEDHKKATEEAKRLSVLVARMPHLGISFEGDTTTVQGVTPGGPAHRAGLRAGDRLEQVGKVKVATPADVREQLRTHKPGDILHLSLRRDDRPMSLAVTIGSPPAREETRSR